MTSSNVVTRTAQQLALAAALAASPACGDVDAAEVDETLRAGETEEPVEASPEPEPEPESEPDATSVTLQNGFLPDPLVIEGTTGGSAQAEDLGEECSGYYDPDGGHPVTTEGVFAELRILVAGPEGSGIVVRAPDSTYICSRTAQLQTDLTQGEHRVFVTSPSGGSTATYRLAFTELVSVTPDTVAAAALFDSSP